MGSKTFLIADFDVGLEKDKEPFLLPDKAFPVLEDAYVFRGRVNRRFGFNLFDGGQLNSRLRMDLGNTGASPFGATVPGAIPIQSPGRQIFSIGDVILTSNNAGAGVQALISTDAAYSGTFDNTNGIVSITHPAIAATAVFYYPGLPVMGLRTRETVNLNFEATTAFDTQYSYERSGTGWDILGPLPDTIGSVLWNGNDSEFFWTVNYFDVFWATNNNSGNHGRVITNITKAASAIVTVGAGHPFVNGDVVFFNEVTGMTEINGLTGTVTGIAATTITVDIDSALFTVYATGGIAFAITRPISGDGIRYFNGTLWRNFSPPLSSATNPEYLFGSLLLIPFKNRLVALNTTEGTFVGPNTVHRQRARWSQNGTPLYDTSNVELTPNPGYSWASGVGDIGRGGFVDAPTSETIVTAQFVQNRLIVFFERSTWELLYTGNEILPFTWQRINTELGCESTFSQIGFDDGVVGIGNRGIHFANTNGVQRIDEKIPDIIGEINNLTQGAERVYGIRDYKRELVMWSFTQFSSTATFPNRNLIYNYRNNTFANFNNYFTCFGYFQKQSGITWATLPYADWVEWTEPWNAGISQARFPLIISGNQQGYTHLFESNNNDASLMVTDVTNATLTLTVPDHNLLDGQFIRLSDLGGITITPAVPFIYQIDNVTANTFTIDATTITGTYTGGTQVEVLNNFDIRTKNFTLFANEGFDTILNDVEVLLEKTSVGECTFNIYQGFNTDQAVPPSYGNSTLNTKPEDNDTFGDSQNKIWHFLPREVISDSFQFQFTLSDAQMRNSDIQGSDFVLHAILVDAAPTGRIRG